jgi:hypothetical protein
MRWVRSGLWAAVLLVAPVASAGAQSKAVVVKYELTPERVTVKGRESVHYCVFLYLNTGKVGLRNADRAAFPACADRHIRSYTRWQTKLTAAEQRAVDAHCITWKLEDTEATMRVAGCDEVEMRT